ncbi:MAG TPA: creatininase family protein [Thermoanaerobaculia bacterium]|nr:creatininase family protein [Thermoanaerobaculia bacterium]
MAAALLAAALALAAPPAKGVLLERLTWIEAEKALTPSTVIVVPLGAASKEHGPHLLLSNDAILAEHLRNDLLARADVVVAPSIPYSFYPAFVEYPGSVSLRLETARDTFVDVCRSLARFGPRRFYVLNTGISTLRALKPASEELAKEGVLMRYTDLGAILDPVEKEVAKQEGGTHADEAETSMLLWIEPASVDMKKAVKDYHPGKGPLSRTPGPNVVFSATGVWGDATLATKEKGERLWKALVEGVVRDVEELRRAPVPPRVEPPAGAR